MKVVTRVTYSSEYRLSPTKRHHNRTKAVGGTHDTPCGRVPFSGILRALTP